MSDKSFSKTAVDWIVPCLTVHFGMAVVAAFTGFDIHSAGTAVAEFFGAESVPQLTGGGHGHPHFNEAVVNSPPSNPGADYLSDMGVPTVDRG